ncbi:acetyl-CoA carboxylase biotin carboxyl carrier protein [Clostridium peptidivorans]|uniref:acetyl-CoA carboxylase biotin carboxyl carrier protein n=1 Tax=Clostridium peptidivorans TaxID=100174 RepID=UPI000BE47289|nr:acetyl-CoA carboxylase biotin carboxyl carrier protein [Clostridium peptidivorans]
MDFKGITELIKVMSSSNIKLLEVQENGISIKMEKDSQGIVIKNEAPVVNSSSYDILDEEVSRDLAVEKKETVNDENIYTIISPIVGTFYSSPSPDKDAFIKEGKEVKIGDTICIIEAMKLMNEIQSEVNGEVIEVLIRDGEMVEYGQEIVKIKKL